MKTFSILLLVFILPNVWLGCGATKKSTMERIKSKKDIVELMRLPDRKFSLASKVLKSEDAKQKSQVKIKVTRDSVPLRKGPGSQYRKIGSAYKNDLFNLLRTERGFDRGTIWYLVQDSFENRFFISSQFSTTVKENYEEAVQLKTAQNKPEKIEIQKRKNISLEKIQSLADTEPPLPKELKEAKHITLNFEGTELYDVITTFSELLMLDYTIEGQIVGQVTLQTFNEIPVKDLYSVLEQILAINNVTVVKSGNFYRFLQTSDAIKKPISIHLADDPNIPDSERMIMQVISLKHTSVEAMTKVIGPLLTTNASFIELPETKVFLLIEMANNAKRIAKVVQALDINKLASSDIQLYKLRSANSETLVKELEDIFSSMGYKDALGETLTFLSLERLNSVLVVNAIDSNFPNVEFWINELDQPLTEGEMSTFVYNVQHGDAGALAGLLISIYSEDTSFGTESKTSIAKNTNLVGSTEASVSGAKTPLSTSKADLHLTGGVNDDIEGDINIIPDPDTNSLIIRTSPRNYSVILSLIEKLDLLPQQVLIEVLIVDLTIDESTDIGVDWAVKDKAGTLDLSGGVNKTVGEGGTTLGSSIGTATSAFLQGGSFFISAPEKVVAQLQLFASQSKTNLLANPILVTTDNQPADISITRDVPVPQTRIEGTGDNRSEVISVEFRNVGTKLTITPKINSDNHVSLKINQEISNLVEGTQGTTSTFANRNVNTQVILKDNEVLVMGGLIRTDNRKAVSGVPLLKDLPFIGKLFGSETLSIEKTELMIFITPHVISNQEDSEFVTHKFKRRLTKFRKSKRTRG